MLSESNQDQCSVVPAQVPSDDESELVLGDRQGRQAVVAVVAPHKPDERSVRRCPSGVVINAAISTFELHDGVVRMRRSGGHKAERQRADCKHKSLHYQPLLLRFCLTAQRAAALLRGFPRKLYGARHATANFSLERPFSNTRSQCPPSLSSDDPFFLAAPRALNFRIAPKMS